MEQKYELKVFKFEATRLKKNEDGAVSDERETFFCEYAFEGDPQPRVKYNRYWEFGDGCLTLVAKDGKTINSIDNAIDWACDQGFRGVNIRGMVDGLKAPDRWAEVRLDGDTRPTLRVTRLQEMPEIDRTATIRESDMSPAQQHRVTIDDVPLFPEGGTVGASDPKVSTLVLRPNLVRELGKVWEDVIRVRSGAIVLVTVDATHHSADIATTKLTIKAPTRKELDGALCAVGVLRPQDVEPDVVEGEGAEPIGFTATVVLAAELA